MVDIDMYVGYNGSRKYESGEKWGRSKPARKQKSKKTTMNEYQEKIKKLMNEYSRFVYKITRNFPKNELYGLTPQFRRATLSIVLNYIEGYARQKILVRLNFLEISYGSLKESKYLLNFSLVEKYLNSNEYEIGLKLAEEIGAMLWKEIKNSEEYCKTLK